MRKSLNLFVLFFLLIVCSASGASGDYDALWKQVEVNENKGLPRSAMKVVDKIISKARQKDHQGQLLAASLYHTRLQLTLTPDSFYTAVPRLERMKRETTDEGTRATIASFLAEVYASNAGRNRNYNTAMDAPVDSLKEWNNEQFLQAAFSNYELSVSRPEVLARLNSGHYTPLYKNEKDGAYFNHDLLQVLGTRALEGLVMMYQQHYYSHAGMKQEVTCRVKKISGDMLDVYRAHRNREAELLLMLDSISYVERCGTLYGYRPRKIYVSTPDADNDARIKASEPCVTYLRMINHFKSIPLVAEVYLHMVNLPATPAQVIDWARQGLALGKGYKRTPLLQDRINELQAARLEVEVENRFYPGETMQLAFKRRHLTQAQLELWRLGDEANLHYFKQLQGKRLIEAARKHGRLVDSQKLTWAERPPYEMVNDTLCMQAPQEGHYVWVVKPQGVNNPDDYVEGQLEVTRMLALFSKLPSGTLECRVVDAHTGKPLEGVRINTFDDRHFDSPADTVDYTARYTTSARGAIKLEKKEKEEHTRYFLLQRGGDRLIISHYFYISRYTMPAGDGIEYSCFTDRAIYRPGHKVHSAGLCYRSKRDEQAVLPRHEVNLELLDAHSNSLAKTTVHTDDMGKWSHTWTLPQRGSLGYYRIKVNQKVETSFRVEEYKRPTFKVDIDAIRQLCRAGDTVQVKGRATYYSGAPLADARVAATTRVIPNYWSSILDKEKSLDTIYTQADGSFVLKVAIPRDVSQGKSYWGVRQRVKVHVMSGAGEEHTAVTYLPITQTGVRLECEIPSMLNKNDPKGMRLLVHGNTGGQLDTLPPVYQTLHRLDAHNKRALVWQDRKVLWQKNELDDLSTLPTARYEIEFWTTLHGDTAREERSFVLYADDDVRPAPGEKMRCQVLRDTIAPGKPACVKVGSCLSDVTLYYKLFARDEILVDSIITFSDSILTFTYDRVPLEADGMMAEFVFVKGGEMFSRNARLLKFTPGKHLRMKWTSFRDRLKPGSEETWRLKVEHEDGTPAHAQVLATLYDASLHAIAGHHDVNLGFGLPAPDIPWVDTRSMYASGKTGDGYMQPWKSSRVPALRYDVMNSRFMWPGMYGIFYCVEECAQLKDVAVVPKNSMRLQGLGKEFADMTMSPMGSKRISGLQLREVAAGAQEAETKPSPAEMPVRTNFSETAFFYPRLMTDEKGEVAIGFTLPDALTSWQFLAFAHTADLCYGNLTDTITASKQVMAQWQLPRFVRRGDEAMLCATINNLTHDVVKGTATLQVLDAESEKVLWSKKMKLKLAAQQDSVIKASFVPQAEMPSLCVCRLMFDAGEHSDGEQQYLPILDDVEWVTETRAFSVEGQADTTILLNALFRDNHGQATQRKLTLEYTGNPLWYAVQALPSVVRPDAKNIIDLALAYYASTLSLDMARQYPELPRMAQLWQQREHKALKSALLPGEVQDIVLQETPWLADAEWQTQRIANLSSLFDANTQHDLQQQWAASMKKLQNADGSFSWYPGMKGSRYLTLMAATAFERAGEWERVAQGAGTTLSKAVNLQGMMAYIFQQMADDVEREKKHYATHKAYLYGPSHWSNYLYVTTGCPKEWRDDTGRRAADYALKRLEAQRFELGLMAKASAAIVFRRVDKKAAAQDMLRSLREHLVSDAQGLHLEYPSNGWVPAQEKLAAHACLMLALHPSSSAHERQEMCKWLIAQKRLQDWGAVGATMEAVHALVSNYRDAFTADETHDILTLATAGRRKPVVLSTAQSEVPGMKQVEATLQGEALSKGVESVRVEKRSKAPVAWGAVYARYRMPMSEVEASATGMSVRVEVSSTAPRVGDKVVVRYVITATQDYDYVCLKAARAACLVPIDATSGTRWNNLCYYQEVRDAAGYYYIDHLPRGTYTIDVPCRVERAGRFNMGLAHLNGVYAPEYGAHSTNFVLHVKP